MNNLTCPRRMQELGPWKPDEGLDSWRENSTCSFCGVLNPTKALESVEQGKQIVPTDKNYKVYVDGHRKVYFQHFNAEQQAKLIELVNGGKVNFGFPGHFYVAPYFMKRVEAQ